MSDFQRTVLERFADRIRKDIIGGGRVFGIKVTDQDADALIVAAFMLGREEQKEYWQGEAPKPIWLKHDAA